MSRFEPGPAPFKSFTLTFLPAENGAYRVTADGETSNGVPINTTYLLKEDGKHVPGSTYTLYSHRGVAGIRFEPGD